jgi:RNA polymerase sigma factor (sigma-70 family)
MIGRRGGFRPFLVRGGKGAEAPGADARRFRELILPHLDSAYNLARYLATDASVAEDIVQEAFLRAFRAFDSYRGESPRAWLFAILRNCWRDRASADRARGRVLVDQAALSEAQAAAVDNHPDDADTPETILARRGEVDAVRSVIAGIPEPFREALVLREMELMSYREIAAITGVPIGTVMSRIARARGMLAALLLPAADPARDAPEEERA